MKGYASDSTISHTATTPATPATATTTAAEVSHNHFPASPNRKKRKCRRKGEQEATFQHVAKQVLLSPSPSPPPAIEFSFPPIDCSLPLIRIKSTGSILKSPEDDTVSASFCESSESLLLAEVSRRRRKSSASHRLWKLEAAGSNRAGLLGVRRGSMDNGMSRLCCGGGSGGGAGGGVALSLSKPPAVHLYRRSSKGSRDGDTNATARHSIGGVGGGGGGKDKSLRCRHLSRSLKGEKERHHKSSIISSHQHQQHQHQHQHQHHEDCSCCCSNGRRKTLNRSRSFSSVGDYEDTKGRTNFEPLQASTSTSGSKWTVYGYL